jgi:hypothetical protein
MCRAALLAAALVVAGSPPARIGFGAVQLGHAASRTVTVHAVGVAVSGAGFSATRTPRGLLIVFEPYELDEEVTGTLTLRLRSGRRERITLSGHGIDTVPPTVEVDTPRRATAGRPLTIHFAATDNDLVSTCTLEVRGHVVATVGWPVSLIRWTVPAGLVGRVRVTIVAVDRAGNRAAASSRAFAIR